MPPTPNRSNRSRAIIFKSRVMLLSIVVPVYNVERYLARCLDSVLDQDLDPEAHEILVVNDGSPDNSLAIAQDYAARHRQIKIISQQNQGLSQARNTGIEHAVGRYIYFIDSDDYLERKVFKTLLEVAQTLDLDFLGFGSARVPNADYSIEPDFSKYRPFEQLPVTDGKTYIGTHNFLNNAWWYLIKREVLERHTIRFVKGIMLEDGIFTTELLLQCQRAAHVSVSVYRYFVNDNSIMTIRDKKHLEKMNRDFMLVIKRFSLLIRLAKEKDANQAAMARLRARQESYAFFLLIRLVKSRVPFSDFRAVLQDMKTEGVYPIKNFIGVDYQSPKEKLFTRIFNNKPLLYAFLKANAVFKMV